MVERASTCKSALFSAEAILEELGIEFSRKASKRLPFDAQFKLLGVQVNLAARIGLSRTAVALSNTPERQDELREELKLILKSGLITPPAAARLAGRLTFATSFVWSRVGAQFARMLSGIGAHGSHSSSELQAACIVMLRVLDSGDRLVPVTSDGPAAWVYTDASAEDSDPDRSSQEVLIGGILYARVATRPLSYFSERVPDFI
eukprot:2062498-Amphidinium_carterae.1